MTELQLYKFIDEHSLEWHRWQDDIILFIGVRYGILEDFIELLGPEILDEEGLDLALKDGYICIPCMNYICEYFDINPDNVFTGEEY